MNPLFTYLIGTFTTAVGVMLASVQYQINNINTSNTNNNTQSQSTNISTESGPSTSRANGRLERIIATIPLNSQGYFFVALLFVLLRQTRITNTNNNQLNSQLESILQNMITLNQVINQQFLFTNNNNISVESFHQLIAALNIQVELMNTTVTTLNTNVEVITSNTNLSDITIAIQNMHTNVTQTTTQLSASINHFSQNTANLHQFATNLSEFTANFDTNMETLNSLIANMSNSNQRFLGSQSLPLTGLVQYPPGSQYINPHDLLIPTRSPELVQIKQNPQLMDAVNKSLQINDLKNKQAGSSRSSISTNSNGSINFKLIDENLDIYTKCKELMGDSERSIALLQNFLTFNKNRVKTNNRYYLLMNTFYLLKMILLIMVSHQSL